MRMKGKRILTICSMLVVLWVFYIIFMAVKNKIDRVNINDINDVVKYIPPKILRTAKWDSSKIPVIVVEEHHEVIPYWFAAAESSLIPIDGVTILHVDGHSDTGIPEVRNNFPLFQWPRSLSQLFTLMQKNDVFVVGASLTGLIKRFIWVWPPWDKVNHDNPHITAYLEIGSTVKLLPKTGQEVLVLCACVTTLIDKKGCYMMNYTSIYNEDFIPIKKDECSFSQNITGIYEEISEGEAIKLLKSGNWIAPGENVILDVDEDYYGCESVFTKLYKSGVKDFIADNMAAIINNMFCSYTVAGEIIADNFYNSVIKIVLAAKTEMLNCRRSTHDLVLKNKCTTYVQLQQNVFNMIPDLAESVKNYKESILCSDNDQINHIFLQGLLRNMVKLTIPQLKVLANVGICLSISPRTLDYQPEMRLCTSYNLPNSTTVSFHSPSTKEIEHRTKRLELLFSAKNLTPKFITITRSVRDGYTPREQSFKIESDIMKVIRSSFLGFEKDMVHFDINLLGGLEGWSGRH
ncbi:hypothetical protein SNE40_018525 [Patella caerulea]|uniref:Uncharacterized protein n=2 Tax=Patella caerulea TaxID=87958 RepID=A0AAN8P899_PATCE